MKYRSLALVALFVIAQVIVAQETARPDAPITNKDVLDMVHAGMSTAVVLAKIQNSVCKFDTSPSALVSLKESGVPDDVLMEMVRNPGRPAKPVADLTSQPNVPTPEPRAREAVAASDNLPEYGDISEIRRMRHVFVVADDIDSQNLMINALRQYDGLDVVASPERADIFVAFTQGSTATSVVVQGLFPGTIDHRTKAQFIVFYKAESGRRRIIWQETEDTQSTSGLVLSRPNEINVIRHFIKAVKKIRGE